MFASLALAGSAGGRALLVPSEAVIRTGARSVVIVAEGEGRFRQREVEPGFESGGKTEIRKGLTEGDKVVVSGQFLIDSEASLRASGTRMEAAVTEKGAQSHSGVGVIVAVSDRELLVRHGEIPSAGMGAMTMPLLAPAGGIPPGLKEGDRIRFEFTAQPDGQFRVTRLAHEDASLPDHGAHK